jgi:hypothetical protein
LADGTEARLRVMLPPIKGWQMRFLALAAALAVPNGNTVFFKQVMDRQ